MWVRTAFVMAVIILSSMLAYFTLIVSPSRSDAQDGQWVQHIPNASQVTLDYWEKNGTSYMNASIWFPTSGYNVSNWGTPSIVGSNISADAEILRWTGVSLPVVTTQSHIYSLGNLSAREYLFIFKAWGYSIKDTIFIVPEFPLFLILPLFMIATLLAVLVYRREHSNCMFL